MMRSVGVVDVDEDELQPHIVPDCLFACPQLAAPAARHASRLPPSLSSWSSTTQPTIHTWLSSLSCTMLASSILTTPPTPQVLTSKEEGGDAAPVSRTEQAKRLLAQYGSAYLITSISFAIVSFAACYAAVSAGTRESGRQAGREAGGGGGTRQQWVATGETLLHWRCIAVGLYVLAASTQKMCSAVLSLRCLFVCTCVLCAPCLNPPTHHRC